MISGGHLIRVLGLPASAAADVTGGLSCSSRSSLQPARQGPNSLKIQMQSKFKKADGFQAPQQRRRGTRLKGSCLEPARARSDEFCLIQQTSYSQVGHCLVWCTIPPSWF